MLTLLSGLRTTSDDSIRPFDCEICGADRHELVKRRRRIGYIFQHHNLVEFLTAGRNVELMFELHPMVDSSEARKLSDQMLTAVGLQRHLDSYPRGMSGGQRQRVAIARALVTSPDLILTDEPTDSLDKTTGRQAVELLESLSRRKSIPMLMVTHDNRILDIADRIVRIEDGHLLEDC